MNGQNANTSGAQVANIGFLRAGILDRFVTFLENLKNQLTKVVNGEADLAEVDYSVKGGSDKISDETMAEISRRLVITLEAKAQGNVVFSATPPTDHSKVWWQVDPVTGIPIGSPKVYNSTTQTWETVQPASNAYVPPRRRWVTVLAAEGQSQHTVNFATMDTTDYTVIVTPTTFISGTWQPAPDTFPTHFGYVITNKGEAELTLNFFGTPEGGSNFEIDVIERVAA
jgi:hypothetical protein